MLLWNDVARVVDPTEYRLFDWDQWVELASEPGMPAIRSARLSVRVPEVVCLVHHDRFAKGSVAFSRRNVARRDHFTCQYCGVQPGVDRITVDHVMPRSQGGPTSWQNCVAACVPCNARKADRTPDQAGMKLKKPPSRPEWRPLYSLRGLKNPSWAHFLEPDRALQLA